MTATTRAYHRTTGQAVGPLPRPQLFPLDTRHFPV